MSKLSYCNKREEKPDSSVKKSGCDGSSFQHIFPLDALPIIIITITIITTITYNLAVSFKIVTLEYYVKWGIMLAHMRLFLLFLRNAPIMGNINDSFGAWPHVPNRQPFTEQNCHNIGYKWLCEYFHWIRNKQLSPISPAVCKIVNLKKNFGMIHVSRMDWMDHSREWIILTITVTNSIGEPDIRRS